MRPQAPPLSKGTAPMLILRVLAVPHLEPDWTDDAPQTHGPLSLVLNFSAAEGEKFRRGGLLLLGAFAPIVGASIRALLLKLPSPYRAGCAVDHYPRSLVLSYG